MVFGLMSKMELLVIVYRNFPEDQGVYELKDKVHPESIVLDY